MRVSSWSLIPGLDTSTSSKARLSSSIVVMSEVCEADSSDSSDISLVLHCVEQDRCSMAQPHCGLLLSDRG